MLSRALCLVFYFILAAIPGFTPCGLSIAVWPYLAICYEGALGQCCRLPG